MNTANKITLVRMVIIPFFMAALLRGTVWGNALAVLLFMAASLTDYADGYVARKYDMITTFGKFVDPLADKLLVASALLIFVSQGRMPAAAAFIIIAREFVVTSLRIVAMGAGRVLAAAWSGKIKTFSQLAAIILMMLLPILETRGISLPYNTIDGVCVWSMTLVSLWSGFDYLLANRDVISGSK